MLRRRVPTSEVVPDDESMSLLLYTSKHIINQLVPKPVYVAFSHSGMDVDDDDDDAFPDEM